LEGKKGFKKDKKNGGPGITVTASEEILASKKFLVKE
jgi:hypothetical protein